MSDKSRSSELLALEAKYRALRELYPISAREPQPNRLHRGPVQHPVARILQLSTDMAESDYVPSEGFRTAPLN